MDKKIRRNRIRRARQVRRIKKRLTSGVLLLAALLFIFLFFVPKVSAKRELKSQAAREQELESKMTRLPLELSVPVSLATSGGQGKREVSWKHTKRKMIRLTFFRR